MLAVEYYGKVCKIPKVFPDFAKYFLKEISCQKNKQGICLPMCVEYSY